VGGILVSSTRKPVAGRALRRLWAWHAVGVWNRLPQRVLDEVFEAQLIDGSRLTGEPTADEV
jgi:hypothetical protein